ncbi:MAG: hypothetical protein KIT57_22830 [Blastocatellales bacterium]|nr:hypothetical protein [Blastocatellales bacterium]
MTELDGKYYTVAFDGSEYFHSTKIECPGCLRRRSRDAIFARRGGRVGFPLGQPPRCCRFDVEEVRNEDGGTNRIARSMPAKKWRSDCAKSIGNEDLSDG